MKYFLMSFLILTCVLAGCTPSKTENKETPPIDRPTPLGEEKDEVAALQEKMKRPGS